MAEWLIAPVLKTGIVRNQELSRVRIPLSPFSWRIGLFLLVILIILPLQGNGSAKLDSRAKKKRKIDLDINELKQKEKGILFKYDLTHPS